MSATVTEWGEGPVPAPASDLAIRQYDSEAVAWSTSSDHPVHLDPVAALVLQIVDGTATLADLVDDMHEVLGLDPAVARAEVVRSLRLFAEGGILSGPGSTSRMAPAEEIFSSGVEDRALVSGARSEMRPIDLAIGDQLVRVLCAADAYPTLQRALEGDATTQEAPLGFVLRGPTTHGRLYVVTDRSGFVLGRTTDRDQALGMLGGHLSALNGPRPEMVRLRSRALLAPDGSAVLAPWPLLHAPPAVESKLADIGYRLVDRLCVDVHPERGSIDCGLPPWPVLRDLDPGPGHASALPDGCEVRGLLLSSPPGAPGPTVAQLVHYLATLTLASEDRTRALQAADVCASMAQTVPLDRIDTASMYDALARHGSARSTSSISNTMTQRSEGREDQEVSANEIEESYDELPYGSKAFAESHPVELSTTAELCGLETAPIERCRVLELGCGEGGNLIPVAQAFPQAECLGVDLSGHQVERGNASIERLGLSNIELRQLDISDLDATFGAFDYIICHGVFSWVPGPVQAKILAVCRENAAPGAVAYISYNALPGWHTRGVIRRLLLQRTEGVHRLADRIALAREVLEAIISDAESSNYGSLLSSLAESVREQDDAYIAHEFLAPVNTPMYHSEFVELAAAHDLRWLGDQRVVANPSLVGHPMISVDPMDPARQEYNDMLSGVGFRRAILCRSDAVLAPERILERFQGFSVSSSLSAPKSVDLAVGRTATFTGADPSKGPISVHSDSAVLKSALKHLARASRPMLVADLVDLVDRDLSRGARTDSDPDVPAALAQELLKLRALYSTGAVQLSSYG